MNSVLGKKESCTLQNTICRPTTSAQRVLIFENVCSTVAAVVNRPRMELFHVYLS